MKIPLLFIELGFNFFLVLATMLVELRALKMVLPFINRVVVAKALWYLLVAFGYALLCVTLLTSWAILSFGHLAAFAAVLLTLFLLVVVYAAYQRIAELSVEEGLFEQLAKNKAKQISELRRWG